MWQSSCFLFCVFFKYTTKEQNFQNTSDDRPFAVDLQYIGVSYVPSGQLREWAKFGRKTNMLFVTRSHIDMIIILYMFPSGSFLAWYLKKKTSTNFHENFSFLVPLEKKKIPAQNNALKNIKWTILEERRNKTFSFSF